MKAFKKFTLIFIGYIIFMAQYSHAKEISYQWNKIFFAGASHLLAEYNNNDNLYYASEKYTLKGVWKKLEDGKIVKRNVYSTNVSNVLLWDNFNTTGQNNGRVFHWSLTGNIKETKIRSLKNGTHIFTSPDGKESNEENQVIKNITFVCVKNPKPPKRK